MASLTLVIENRIKVSIMKQRELDIEADEMHRNCTAVLTACRDILALAAEHDRFTFARQLAAASRLTHHKPHHVTSRRNTSSRSFAHPAPRTSPGDTLHTRSSTTQSTTAKSSHRTSRHPTSSPSSRSPPSSKPTHPFHTHRSSAARSRPHLSASPPKVGTSVRRFHRQTFGSDIVAYAPYEDGSAGDNTVHSIDDLDASGKARPWYLRRLVLLSLTLLGAIWPFIERLRLGWWLHLRKGYDGLGKFE